MKVKRREGWQCTQCKGINYHLENCPEIQAGEPVRKEDGISKFQAIINSCREEGKKTTMKLYTGAEILIEANKQRGRKFNRDEHGTEHFYFFNQYGQLIFCNELCSQIGGILAHNDWHFVDEEEEPKVDSFVHIERIARDIAKRLHNGDLFCVGEELVTLGLAISDYTYERVMRERK